jgi:hypothetical protein
MHKNIQPTYFMSCLSYLLGSGVERLSVAGCFWLDYRAGAIVIEFDITSLICSRFL